MSVRDNAILEALTQRKKVNVTELAGELGVSMVTMRKDLTALEQQGLIVREHGFAALLNPDNVRGRLAYHHEEKVRIARRAARLVSDGDTVMIENGSCCALLAKEIAETLSDVTIVTNSAFIAEFAAQAANSPNGNGVTGLSVVLLGGNYQATAQVNVGPLARTCAKSYLVQYLFVGADGFVPSTGFTNNDALRAEATAAMAEQAEQVVVLTESEKFARRGVTPLQLDGPHTMVITDGGVDDTSLTALDKLGIKVDLVR